MHTKSYKNEINYLEESLYFHYYDKTPKKAKHPKKKGNKCYCLSMLKNLGPINIIKNTNTSKIYINKMKLVDFEDHFDDLYEKGRMFRQCELKDNNKKTIPHLNFWYQRYYYYSQYDEGIMMDKESN